MSIITKRGDCGTTELISESVKKTDCRLELIGTVDEVIAILSIANSLIENNKKYVEEITICQEALYRFNAQISGAEFMDLTKFNEYFEESVCKNESINFRFSFTNTKIGSVIDYARAVVRRAERCFYKTDCDREDLKIFMNMISDYLYVLSRMIDSEELKC